MRAGGPVILGRWQDVLPGTYDPALAVVITDPPYGLAAGGGLGVRSPGSHLGLGRAGGETRVTVHKGYADDIPWGRHVEEVLDTLPAKRHAKRALNRPGIVPYLWQGWAVYGRLKIDRHRQAPRGDAIATTHLLQRDANDHRRRTDHRAMTPLQACLWIVDTWADPGCVVIDPFAGMGTIGLAARELGFDYIGAEISPDYAAAANDAFLTESIQLGLPA